ncbi:type II toxin-antitoxin system RelE/ParE family toxin [Nevskia sp.]|uniref:type II toxin-antitoxin system RelE/ParE family toxin n=1 Tax=Nevskia sp. TaxID=1929292 RepID=UPI0025CF58D2|nr:type II toxin-antitoxin system RelE/ParE family toxin [Nevskia sp.]
MTPVRFLPEAEAELLHEIGYYSEKREGVGIRFVAAVEAAIELTTRHPRGGAPTHDGTRSVLVKGFPFSVIYRADAAERVIVAIAAHHRRPGYWVTRIG